MNVSRYLLFVVAHVVFALTLARGQAPTGDNPSLDSLRAEMIAQGASPDPDRRDAMLTALERLVLQKPYDQAPETVRHYRLMCDHAIDEIASQHDDTPGVRIWKFYSSGYVCRSGRSVFAFDLNQGINSKRWIPSGRADWSPPPKTGTDFVLTDAQITRLAAWVDVAFYSHQDEDHVCYPFIRELVKAGKTVVVTAPVLALPGYCEFADKLVALTPQAGKVYSFGPLKVEGLATRQVYADPKRAPVANNIYLVTTPTDIVLMHKGDANVGEEAWAWLEAYHQRGGKIDLYLGGYSPFGTKDKDPTGCTGKIHETFDDFVIPGHMYEWSHLEWGLGGLLTYDKVMRFDGGRIRLGRGIVLSWGESYVFRPQ